MLAIRLWCLIRSLLLIGHLYLSAMWMGVDPKADTKDVSKRDWTMCSKYDNSSRFNSQHNWGDLYDLVINMRVFTLIMNKIFI